MWNFSTSIADYTAGLLTKANQSITYTKLETDSAIALKPGITGDTGATGAPGAPGAAGAPEAAGAPGGQGLQGKPGKQRYGRSE